MSEFATGPSFASAHSYATGSGDYASRPAHSSPREVAQDAIVGLERKTEEVQRRLDAVHEAYKANDPARWSGERTRLERAIRDAHQARDRIRSLQDERTREQTQRAASAERQLESLEASVSQLGDAPIGFAHVPGETEIERVLDAPMEGGAAAGFQKKEAQLRARFDELSVTDSRAVASRLRRARPNDPVAARFARMTADRRQRLLQYLDNAARRAAVRREAELRDARTAEPKTSSDEAQKAAHHVELDVLDHPHFEPTELGSISKPIAVTFVNRGDEAITIDGVSVSESSQQQSSRTSEIDVITHSAGTIVQPGTSTTIEVAFRPTTPVGLHAWLELHGRTPSRSVKRGALLIAPTPLAAVAAHAEERELALADRESRDVESSTTAPATATYHDMLAAVLAAERLTDRCKLEDARRVLEPVEHRLAQLDEEAYKKLAKLGAGNVAGHAIFDTAKGAVSSWIRRLRLGAPIRTESMVLEFRMGAEAIRLVTGERDDAPTLAAFDHASRMVGIGAAALVAGPGIAALAIEEAGLLAFAARGGARSIAIWALHNPAQALAVAEVLLGLGVQVGEDGWEAFADQLKNPVGCLFIVMQVIMDGMHIRAAGGEPRHPAMQPGPEPVGGPIAAQRAPHAANDSLELARGRLKKLRSAVSGIAEQASTDEAKRTAEPKSRHDDVRQQTEAHPDQTHGVDATTAKTARTSSTPEYPVARGDLHINTEKTERNWTIEIKAPLSNGRYHVVGEGLVSLDASGHPIGGPEFYIEKNVHVNGVDGKVQIYDRGTKQSATDLVLDEAIARFKTEFGHAPDTLPGHLAFENKRNFQRAYAVALRDGKSVDDARQIAIRSISFGRSRIERGYDDIKVEATNDGLVDLGEPLGVQRVPTVIHIEARRSKP
jgi:hypothetical protein